MGKRLTYEFVKGQFEREGYELLSKEYVDSKTKLKYRCPEGHEHSMPWRNWQQKHRCPYCAKVGKPIIDFIRSEFEKEGYKLLVTEYKNVRQKIDYICPKGHEYSTTWNRWRDGRRCPFCYNDKVKKDINFIRSEFAKEGYKLLSTEYINCEQKLDYICPKGHKHFISWSKWNSGKRCFYCAIKTRAIKAKKDFDIIRKEFNIEGYTLLTEEYINSRQKLNYICPNKHKHSICWGDWQQGSRCPYCFGRISKGEVQVRNFVESLGTKVSPNDRNQIFNPETGCGLELDIFMPTLNKAIEYNGEYWHQDKTKDLFKQKLCELKGINLLIIWENEWEITNKECKDKIKTFVFDNARIFK